MVQTVPVKTVEQLNYSKERVFRLQLDLSLVVFPESPTFIKSGLDPLQLKQKMAILVSRLLDLTAFLKIKNTQPDSLQDTPEKIFIIFKQLNVSANNRFLLD